MEHRSYDEIVMDHLGVIREDGEKARNFRKKIREDELFNRLVGSLARSLQIQEELEKVLRKERQKNKCCCCNCCCNNRC